jgi:hypothetical protein
MFIAVVVEDCTQFAKLRIEFANDASLIDIPRAIAVVN